ncbi:MAG TPA: NAD(P)/FAD-dependent oxidoreductase, partial [Thermomicrobiaceae bacterium]|nr:NAD(P)/FAD-dependent oxidoreductase [Thermomicrobiaceae bacterium]
GKLEQIRVEGAAYAVDTVVIALGRQPDAALALQARVSLRYDEASRAQVPAVDESGRTSNASLFLAGDAVGVVSEPIAYAQGWLAGLTAAGAAAEAVKAARRNLLEAESAAADRTAGEIHFSLADLSDDVPVCRCEQVDAASVRQAIREGALTLNDVKRRTRCGMGLCQGIFCLGTVAQMIHQHAGVPYEQLEPMTSRPPARAIPLEALAAMSEDEIPIEEVEGRAG